MNDSLQLLLFNLAQGITRHGAISYDLVFKYITTLGSKICSQYLTIHKLLCPFTMKESNKSKMKKANSFCPLAESFNDQMTIIRKLGLPELYLNELDGFLCMVDHWSLRLPEILHFL